LGKQNEADSKRISNQRLAAGTGVVALQSVGSANAVVDTSFRDVQGIV
jgi:hypothetical protein